MSELKKTTPCTASTTSAEHVAVSVSQITLNPHSQQHELAAARILPARKARKEKQQKLAAAPAPVAEMELDEQANQDLPVNIPAGAPQAPPSQCPRDRRARYSKRKWKDYGAPQDHPYIPLRHRVNSALTIRSAQEYSRLGGAVFSATPQSHRTCESDTDPTIATFESGAGIWLVTQAEMRAVVEQVASEFQQAKVSTEGGGKVSSGRSNEVAWLPHDSSDAMASVVKKMACVVGLPPGVAEQLQVVKYTRKHWDAFDNTSLRGKEAVAKRGNRLVTCLLYLSLSEDLEGGCTDFINLQVSIEPSEGRLLVSHNCYDGTSTRHPDSNHGMAVLLLLLLLALFALLILDLQLAPRSSTAAK